jgi:hypothetical protein
MHAGGMYWSFGLERCWPRRPRLVYFQCLPAVAPSNHARQTQMPAAPERSNLIAGPPLYVMLHEHFVLTYSYCSSY